MNIREQQVPKFGILKVVRYALRFRGLLAGFPIGFEVAPNRFTRCAPGSFDVLSVGGDRQVGRLHCKSRTGLFQHDKVTRHLRSSLIFFTVSTARPTGMSF